MQNQSCFGGRLIVAPLVHLLWIPSTPMHLKLINNPLCYLTDHIIIREVQLKSCHTLIKKCSFNFFEQCIYQGVLLQSVYGQLPPRSWSTIGCHYSPQSLSSAAIRIHHQLPPRSWSTTTARCQHDKGSAIIITTSQHDTESAILDPPLPSLIRDPQVVLHDVATAVALDLRTIGQRNSGDHKYHKVLSNLYFDFSHIITKNRTQAMLDGVSYNRLLYT